MRILLEVEKGVQLELLTVSIVLLLTKLTLEITSGCFYSIQFYIRLSKPALGPKFSEMAFFHRVNGDKVIMNFQYIY